MAPHSKDTITGQMTSQWRLNASTSTHIGRATVNGSPVLTTSIDDQKGIEVRSQNIDLEAVTQTSSPNSFSALGWETNVREFSATLNLPPGWRVIAATGVDGIRGTWLQQWDLWDVFWVMILFSITKKYYGLKTSLLALVMLVLGYHERQSAVGIWAVLILLTAFIFSVGPGKIRSFAKSIAGVCTLLFVVSLVSYSVLSFRLALYPALERTSAQQSIPVEAKTVLKVVSEIDSHVESAVMYDSMAGAKRQSIGKMERRRSPDWYQVGKNDNIQTGPGLPQWRWNAIWIESSGSISPSQTIKLFYMPQTMTALWRIFSVLLIGLVGYLTLGKLYAFTGTSAKIPAATTVLPLLFILVSSAHMLTPTAAIADEYPPTPLLEQLESRVIEKPYCMPSCLSTFSGKISATQNSLTFELKVYADVSLSYPIPISLNGYELKAVTVDGSSVSVVGHNSQYLIPIDKGHHQITIIAQITGEQVNIHFPHSVRNVQFQSNHWLVDGLYEGRVTNRSITINKKVKSPKPPKDTLIPDTVAPFVIVERSLSLGVDWTLKTQVRRVAPYTGPINVSVKLLDGEKIMSSRPRVRKDHAIVQFSSTQDSVQWQSSLEIVESLTFTARPNEHYVETWRLEPSSLWSIGYQGINPVQDERYNNSLSPLWKPWPGEQLTVNIDRPEGIAGPVSTIERLSLIHHGGDNIQHSQLEIDLLASQGMPYELSLPEQAQIERVSLGEKTLSIPEGHHVRVNLYPGRQMLKVDFSIERPIDVVEVTPSIALPDSATNIDLMYKLPNDRWLLYIDGPTLGASMLYWGVLCVILGGAFALSRIFKVFDFPPPVSLWGWLLLGIGLSTVNTYGALIIGAYFLAMAYRHDRVRPDAISRRKFNCAQVSLVLLGVVAVFSLLHAVSSGLLSTPNMKVAGHGSYGHMLKFYQDVAPINSVPHALIINVPMWVYRLFMLAWSLWIAMSVIAWAKWSWVAFSMDCAWKVKTEVKDYGET
jgi:hypothetical protein